MLTGLAKYFSLSQLDKYVSAIPNTSYRVSGLAKSKDAVIDSLR